MSRLQDFRRSYPQYNDLSDEQLLAGIHQKSYSDMPMEDFTRRMLAPSTQPATTEPEFRPGSGSSLLSGVYGLGGSLFSAVEGTGSLAGSETIERIGREGRIRSEAAAEAALPSSERQSFAEAEGIRENVRAAGQALGMSLPSVAPGIAGAIGGAAIGSAVPVIGTGLGAIIGGTAASLPQFFGSNRQRQIQESGAVQSELAALGTAVPQALSEAVVDRLTLGLGRVLGIGGEDVAREVLPRIARGIGVGAAASVPAEVIQQAMERAQAGLDVLSPEAMAEYREAGTAAAVVGGGLGGTVAGVLGRAPGPSYANESPELRDAIDDLVRARGEAQPPVDVEPAPNAEAPVVTPVTTEVVPQPDIPTDQLRLAGPEMTPSGDAATPSVEPPSPSGLEAVIPEAAASNAGQDTTGGEPPTAPDLGQTSAPSASDVNAEIPAEAPVISDKSRRAQEKARLTVSKFLNDIRSRGGQASIFASDLENLLNDRVMTTDQIYRGFLVADTLANTIPASADYRLKFVQDLVVDNERAALASGAAVGDRAQGRVVFPEKGSAGLIELSLAKDMVPLLNETAAHEGFHILQTYFSEYDKPFSDRIGKFFKDDMKISELEPSIKRRLQALKPPASKISYYDSLVGGLGDRLLSAKEAQAYAFGSLIDASARGKPTTGILPPFQRFVLSAKEFMAKLKSALNNDGFESATDILTQAQRRGSAMTQAAPTGGGVAYSARQVSGQDASRTMGGVAGLPPFGQRTPTSTTGATQRAELNVQYDIVSKALGKRFGRFIPPAKIESFFMKFQDKMLSVGRMIDEIRAAGGNVTVAMDAYLKEDLLQGKVATMLEKRSNDLYNPLVKAVADSGLPMQDFENFLYARHAPERNAYVASINPEMPDGGSGLTNQQAKDMMSEFQKQGKAARLTELAKMFDAIIADTNKLRVESGLTPDFSVIKMTEDGRPLPDYKNYAPLRNFVQESVDGDETVKDFRPSTGRALGARGREDKRVTGRDRKAGDILAHAMMQNTQAVIRSEQNKVGQSFLALIRSNPDQSKKFAEVIASAPLRTTIVNGVVKTVPDPFYKNDPDVLVVKEGGKEVAIRIFDDNVARAMGAASAISPSSKNILIQGMGLVNRYLAKVNTAYNPEFLITNFTRDLQTFGINVQQFDVDGLTQDTMRDVKGAMSGIRDVTRGTSNNPEMARYFERFRELGGTTDMYGFADIETRIAEINEIMNTVGAQAKSWKDMAKVVSPVIKFLEDYNTVVENGIRTALFKNLVERGFNEEQAAQAAKNITVNFSKGGENRALMNALYLFYNASLQGSMAMMNAIGRSPKVRKIVAGVVVAGVLQDVMNNMLSDVDDDEEKVYDKIPDHVLKRSFVLMDPFGLTERGYFSFPMPYGFNAFFNMGREMSKTARGATDPMKAAGSIVGTFVDSFNPIGGSESILNFMAPTIIDPVVDITQNRDFAGRPIVPERGGFGPQPPESQKYWNNTFAPYVGISNFLNEVTGGTRIIPGGVDISPSVIQYAVNYATGGVGKFVERSFNTAFSTIPDALRGDLEELDVKGIPLLRSLYGNVTSRNDMERYMERMEEVLRVRQEIRDARQYGQPERIEEAMRRYPGQVEIMEAFSRLSSQRTQISRRINEINRNPNIDADSKKEIIKALRDQQNALVGVANQLYSQSVDRRQ